MPAAVKKSSDAVASSGVYVRRAAGVIAARYRFNGFEDSPFRFGTEVPALFRIAITSNRLTPQWHANGDHWTLRFNVESRHGGPDMLLPDFWLVFESGGDKEWFTMTDALFHQQFVGVVEAV